jgi:hypothetical protein
VTASRWKPCGDGIAPPIPEFLSRVTATATAGPPSSHAGDVSPEKELPVNKPSLRDVNAEQKPEAEGQSAEPRDIFDDLDKLRLSQDFQKTAGVKKLLTTVPVRKPNPQTFIRVHPSEEYRDAFTVIELKDDREVWLVPIEIAQSLPGEYVMATLYTAITRQGDLFVLWARLPGEDGKDMEWWRSLREGAELAMTKWVRIKANNSIGAYDIFEAENNNIPEPKWPELSFKEILRIAFKGRIIQSLDHPVIKRLRGL